MPKDTITKVCEDSRLESKASGDTGTISGYASVFDIIDRQGDIIRKGAFARSINNRVMAGKVGLYVTHLAHGGDLKEFIGEITEAHEDDFGLWISAKLSDAQTAQETRSKVVQSPNMFGLSVGFEIIPSGAKKIKTGREFTEVILREVTITAAPANEMTNAVAKKEDIPTEDTPADESDSLAVLREEVEALRAKVDELTRDSDSTAPAESDMLEAKADKQPAPADYSALDESNRRKREIAILEAETNG